MGEKSSEIIKNTITFENFNALLKAGIRPGEIPLNQLVSLLDAVNLNCADYADELKIEELAGTLGSRERAQAMRSIFRAHRIPIKEHTAKEAKEAFEMLDKLEEINDGLCEYLLRNGVDPTIYNMVRLQYERQTIRPVHIVTKKESSWSFNDNNVIREEEEIRIIREAGLEPGDFSKKHIKWLREKGIYASAQNLQLLNALWSISLPIEDEAAALLFIEAIKDGRSLKDSFLCKTGGESGKEYDFRNRGKKEDLFVNEIRENLHIDAESESRKVLHDLEEAFHKEYLKNHSEAEYRKEEYRAFLKDLDLIGTEAGILNALFVPASLDNHALMRILLSPEGENFFEKLAFFIGGTNQISIFKREKTQLIGESESYKKAIHLLYDKVLGEEADKSNNSENIKNSAENSEKEKAAEKQENPETEESKEGVPGEKDPAKKMQVLKEAISVCRMLLFMDELKDRGYEEVPVLLGKKWIRIRLKKEGEKDFSALTNNEVTGGFLIKYSEKGGDASVIVVGERPDVLEEFKESGLLTERFKKLGKSGVSITYLVKEEFSFAEHFYPSF